MSLYRAAFATIYHCFYANTSFSYAQFVDDDGAPVLFASEKVLTDEEAEHMEESFLDLEGSTSGGDVKVCPGDTRGDFKCNHDQTHRVCAELVEKASSTCEPLKWGDKNFWQITRQTEVQWNEDICKDPNHGDSWCICMWATASLIKEVGCENVHIHCESTDVEYVLSKYQDGQQDLSAAHECLETKCPRTTSAKTGCKNGCCNGSC